MTLILRRAIKLFDVNDDIKDPERLQLSLKYYQLARENFENVLSITGPNRIILLSLAEVLFYEAKYDLAITSFQELLVSDEKDTEKLNIYTNVLLAKSYMKLCNYKSAFQNLQTSLMSIIPGDPTNVKSTREIFYLLSKIFYELKEYHKSIDAAEAAIEMNRTYPGVYYPLAESYMALNDLDNAILSMKRAVMFETNWDPKNKELVLAFYNDVVNLKESATTVTSESTSP